MWKLSNLSFVITSEISGIRPFVTRFLKRDNELISSIKKLLSLSIFHNYNILELERYQEAEDDITTDDDELTPSLPINHSHVQYKKPSRASRMSRGSPFGGSRHATPRGSEKIRKNITPSPLDSGNEKRRNTVIIGKQRNRKTTL